MAVELSKDARVTAVASIERWFSTHMDQNIGNMQAAELLDFFLKELAPSVYNRGVADAQTHLLARVNEVDIDCHESEFGYWNAGRRRGT